MITVDPSFLAMPMAQQPTQSAAGTPIPLYVIGGTVYDFVNAGDAIPPHAHPAGEGHIVVCLSGSVQVVDSTTGITTTLTDALGVGPSVLYISDTDVHSVVAVTPGSVTLHVRMATVDPANLAARLGALQSQVATINTAVQSLQTLIGSTTTAVP